MSRKEEKESTQADIELAKKTKIPKIDEEALKEMTKILKIDEEALKKMIEPLKINLDEFKINLESTRVNFDLSQFRGGASCGVFTADKPQKFDFTKEFTKQYREEFARQQQSDKYDISRKEIFNVTPTYSLLHGPQIGAFATLDKAARPALTAVTEPSVEATTKAEL